MARRNENPQHVEPPFARLPAIAYADHPNFAGSRRATGVAARLFALARVAEFAAYTLAVRMRHVLRRRAHRPIAEGEIVQALRRDGIAPVRLAEAERQRVAAASHRYFARLDASRAAIARGRRGYCDNQLDTRPRDAADLFAAVEGALAGSGILDAIRGYLGCHAQLRQVTLQVNDADDTFWREPFEARGEPVPAAAFFHVDNTWGVVKAMLYLSPVGAETGPFGYVPGTHRIATSWLDEIVMRATDIWLDVHPAERPYFLALPRRLQRKAKFGDDIRDGDPWGKWLVDHERVFTSADADAVVFDVRGIHRGGMVRHGERRVIQVLIS